MEDRLIFRARRILMRMKRYENLLGVSNFNEIFDNLPLDENEYLIGVYRNDVDFLPHQVLITNRKFYIEQREGWEVIPYIDICEVHSSPDKKSISGLNLYLKNGNTINLPIYGADGQFRDAYTFYRFVLHAIDYASEQ